MTEKIRKVTQLVNGLLRASRRGFSRKKYSQQKGSKPSAPVDG